MTMAAAAPSISDILMLSQLAWRVGCAFNGRAGAPEEFHEIDREIKGLTTAVTLMAESVDDDGGLLSRADAKTRAGLDIILGSARQTLNNLESFINQYQEVRRPNDASGLAPRRAWKQILVRNYHTIMWTTDGGGIQSLRNMLAMHTQSINMATRALQSRSLRRLENIMDTVATQMSSIHNPVEKAPAEQTPSPVKRAHGVVPEARDPPPATKPVAIPIPQRSLKRPETHIEGKIDKMIHDLAGPDFSLSHNVWQKSSPPSSLPLSAPPSKPLPVPDVTSLLASIQVPSRDASPFGQRRIPSPSKSESPTPMSRESSPEGYYAGTKNRAGNMQYPQSPPSSYESGDEHYMKNMHSGMKSAHGSNKAKYQGGLPFDRSSNNSFVSSKGPYPKTERTSELSFGNKSINPHDSLASSSGGSIKGQYLGGEAYNPHNSQLSAKDQYYITSQPRPETSHGAGIERRFSPPQPERPGSSSAARNPSPSDYQFKHLSRSPPPQYQRPAQQQYPEKGDWRGQPMQPQYSLPATPPPSGELPGLPPYVKSEITESRMAFNSTDLNQLAKQPISKEQPAEAPREKNIFSGLTILCEVQGASIDYTQAANDGSGDNTMVNACMACKIYLVTKHHKFASGDVCFMTSIWVLSDDGSVRIQQRIPDGTEVIPYTVWGNTTNVILRFPTEIEFYEPESESHPFKVASTEWVSYVFPQSQDNLGLWSAFFEKQQASTLFQSALMGQKLLLSVKAKRVMRLHEGISGAFAFAEQLCGLENLRIFQDSETGTATVMIHYVSQFQDGYMTFSLNGYRNPIRIIEVDDTIVRVRGIRIAVDGAKSGAPSIKASKAKHDRTILGAKIEFCTAMDKQLFMRTMNRVRAAATN